MQTDVSTIGTEESTEESTVLKVIFHSFLFAFMHSVLLGSSVTWQTHGVLRGMHVTEAKLAFHIEFISGS